MSIPTRRDMLAATASGTAMALAPLTLANEQDKAKPPMTDRDIVLACGLTEAEADCWELIGKAAGKFFELPKLHSMDDHEVSHAIHVVQHKLLSRPVYRRYLEMAKAQRK